MQRSYEATTTIIIRPQARADIQDIAKPVISYSYSTNIARFDQIKRTYVSLIKSDVVLRPVVKQLKLDKEFERGSGLIASFVELAKNPVRFLLFGSTPTMEVTPTDRAVEKLAGKLDVTVLSLSNVFHVTANSDNAKKAAKIANHVAGKFIEFNKNTSAKILARNLSLLDNELLSIDRKIEESRTKIHDLRVEVGLDVFSSFASEHDRIKKKIIVLEDEYELSRRNRPVLLKNISNLESKLMQLVRYEKNSYIVVPEPKILKLEDELIQLRLQIAEMSADHQPTSQKNKPTKLRIEAIKKEIAMLKQQQTSQQGYQVNKAYAELEKQLLSARIDLESQDFTDQSVAQEIDKYKRQLNRYNDIELVFQDANRELDTLNLRKDTLVNDIQTLVSLSQLEYQEIEILDTARPGRYPTVRNVPIIVYAVIGFIGGIALSFLLIALGYFGTQRKSA